MRGRFWRVGLPLLALVGAGGGAVWTLMAHEHPPGDPLDQKQVNLGEALYEQDCARCHGADLSGEFGWLKKENDSGLSEAEIERMLQSLDNVAPAHDNSGFTWRLDDETLFSVIKDGPAIALSKPGSRMPGFEKRLNDDEIWAVVAFMKSNWMDDPDLPD